MSSNNKAVKNALEKLFSMKLTNVISFLSVSERKKKTNKNARVITGLSITGNNEIRLLTFIFINNKTTTTKKI